jgi:hypothetical protein
VTSNRAAPEEDQAINRDFWVCGHSTPFFARLSRHPACLKWGGAGRGPSFRAALDPPCITTRDAPLNIVFDGEIRPSHFSSHEMEQAEPLTIPPATCHRPPDLMCPGYLFQLPRPQVHCRTSARRRLAHHLCQSVARAESAVRLAWNKYCEIQKGLSFPGMQSIAYDHANAP